MKTPPKNTSTTIVPVALLAGTLASALPAHAQWTRDGANLAIADASGDQVQPIVVAIPSGGAYIGWFDNQSGGYDVYCQRVDARGVEQWAHGGVLVADRGFSSTQGWGMDIDASGNALLTFRDDRFTGARITAAKVAPDGTLVWGADGIQLTDGTTNVSQPDVAGTTDGSTIVAWGSSGAVRLQSLDADGAPQWANDVVLDSASFLVADLNASDAGSVIIAMTRGFPGPRFNAQKISAAGDVLWDPGTVFVFDGALQNGNFPKFVTDGAGGAVFGWYGTGPLQCYVQHVDASGTEVFPHNGVAASTVGSRIRVSPSVGYAGGQTFLFWTEQNSTQSMWGVYGQRFDAAGARQWTDAGRAIVDVGTTELTQVRTLPSGDGAMVMWVDKPSPPFGQRVLASRVDGNGDFTWPAEIIEACSVVASKSRMAAALDASGAAVLAWSDGRTDGADVYAQNVTAVGTLGIPGDVDGNGMVNFQDILALLGAWGDCPAEGPCPADFNGDGTVTFADLLVVLANWG